MSESLKISFTTKDGSVLAGRLEKADRDHGVYALFAHCFTCSKDIAAASRISRALTAHNINVLRFDFTGLGNSEGDFANTNFSSNVQDLVCAADFLRVNYQAPQLIIGHSLGGAAVLAAANQILEARGIVTIGSPFDPEHVADNFKADLEEIKSKGEAEVKLAGRKFRIKKQFIDDLASQSMTENIAHMRKALLVFHSPQDEIVGIENARAIYAAAKHPKSFISLDGADHLLSDPQDSTYVAGAIAAWASRYLEFAESEESTDSFSMPSVKNGISKPCRCP